MVETRTSGPVEEGEEESVQDLEAEMAELAVERAKRKAARDMDEQLPARTSSKKRKSLIGNAVKKAGNDERAAQAQKAQRRAADKERWGGWLEGTLKRKKGQLLSKPEVINMLHHYYSLLLHDGMTPGAATETAASAHNMAPNTVRGCIKNFEATDGEVIVKDGAGRGGIDKCSLLPETQQQMEQYIGYQHKIGAPVYARDMWTWLQSDPKGIDNAGGSAGVGSGGVETVPDYDKDRDAIDVSEGTVHNWLEIMGYKRMAGATGYTVSEDRKARIREYLIDLSKALCLANSEEEKYKLVYMDESYIHINHRDNVSYYKPGENQTRFATGKGNRIIIVHAITEDGPVVTTKDGFPIEEGWFKGEREKKQRRAEANKRKSGRRGGGARGGNGRGGGRLGGQSGRLRGRGGGRGGGSGAPAVPQVGMPAGTAGGKSMPVASAAAGETVVLDTEGGGEVVQRAAGKRTVTPTYKVASALRGTTAKRKAASGGPAGGGGGQLKRHADGGAARGGAAEGNGRGGAAGSGGSSQAAKRKTPPAGGGGGQLKRHADGGAAGGESAEGNGRGGAAGSGGSSQAAKRKTPPAGGGGGQLKRHADGGAAGGESAEGNGRGGAAGGGGSGKGKNKGKARDSVASGGGAGLGAAEERAGNRLKIVHEETAEMMFPAGEKDSKSDYHDNMDADIFMEWLEKRLLPAFQKLHPGFKMILILDNAPYHHGMVTLWKNPLLATKEANLATLRTMVERKYTLDRVDGQEVDGIKAFRPEGTVFFPLPKVGEEFRRRPTGPSTEEVQRATYRIMRQTAPEMLETRAETFFRERRIGKLLHTPPYCPNAQPIELLWSHGKNDVASNFKGRRSLADVHQALREAWYGRSERVKAANCFKLVKHSFKYVKQLLEQDDLLQGEVILPEESGDKTRMILEKDTIPTNYLVSKHGRLGRAPEDAGVENQAHDDAGPTPLAEITIDGPQDIGAGVEA